MTAPTPHNALPDALAQKADRMRRCVARAREAFALLGQRGIIPADQVQALQNMAGFRNLAVHPYEAPDMSIVQAIITHRLDALLQLAATLLTHSLPLRQN